MELSNGTLKLYRPLLRETLSPSMVEETGRLQVQRDVRAEGEDVYMTKSPKLSWLNGTKSRLEVNANMKTGDFEIKVYSQ